MSKRKLKVFLSHASNDQAAGRQLYDQLNAEGWIDVWLADEKLLPGQDWNLEIEKAVNDADVAVVCISKSSTTQQGLVQKEMRLIWDASQNMPEGTIFLIPLKLEECEAPFLLRSLRFADYFEKEREKGYQRLLAGLRLRAEGLGNVVAKSAPAHSKAPAKSDVSAPVQPDQIGSGDLSVGGDANNAAIFTGHHARVTINNYHYGSATSPPAQPEAPDEKTGDDH